MSTQNIPLPAQTRTTLGSRASKRLRRDGRLPAVIYGHGEQNLSVTLPLKEAVDHLRHGHHLFEIKLDGASQQCLVKEVQYDHLGLEVLHVDLFRVNLDEEVTTEVPVVLSGEARGAKAGGVLTQLRDTIEVVCRVRDLPDEIRVDVSNLDVGDTLHLNEIELPAGVKLPEYEGEFLVAQVAAPKVSAADEEPLDVPAEPQIMEKGKKDKEAEAK